MGKEDGCCRKMKRLYSFYILAIYIIFGILPATAGDVSLAWDPSTSEGVTGYHIYVGTASGSYDRTDDAGNVTTYTVNNLEPGYTYYFAATAYDESGNESGYSNEVFTFVGNDLDPPEIQEPLSITGPLSLDITATTARLSWKASMPCTCRIEYQYDGGTFSSLIVDSVAVTDHYIRLTELNPKTIYQYEVYCTDLSGNMVVAKGTFSTK